jgi:hypothetical protein
MLVPKTFFFQNHFKASIIAQRLSSHLIPLEELRAGSYEGLDKKTKAEKIKIDFEAFINRRAILVANAVQRLANGEDVSAVELLSS